MEAVLPYNADYHPLLGQMMNEMNFSETINKVVGQPKIEAKIDTGTFVAAFVQHLLGDVKIKLYTMNHFFEDKPLPLLFPWKPDLDLNDINDDRAGRVLDEIWKAGPEKVFSAVATEAIRIHDLDTSEIHGDTTSKSFYGAFKDQDEEGNAPLINHGKSKDKRPDLKQIVLGIQTTADGVPIIGDVDNGNASDKTVNGRWIEGLRSALGKDADDYLLYVADSALVTNPNLRLMRDPKYNVDFISRLPGNFAIEMELKLKALSANKWEDIGKLAVGKRGAFYQYYDTTGNIEEETYRFVVVKSDHKDHRKLSTLNRHVTAERKELKTNLKDLGKRRFVCMADAEIETETFTTENKLKYHQIEWEIKQKEEKVKRGNRGRPKNGEKPKYRTSYYLHGKPIKDEDAIARERKLCGLYVMITTLLDVEKHSARTILEKYKGQGVVERIFTFLKSPQWLGSFCLKTNERIAALGYILIMAAMVYTLWERRVRKALSNEDEMPLEGLDRKKTRKPTAYALQMIMSPIMVLGQIVNGNCRFWLPRPLKPNQKRVCKLSGFSEDIFST
jgi:transposase